MHRQNDVVLLSDELMRLTKQCLMKALFCINVTTKMNDRQLQNTLCAIETYPRRMIYSEQNVVERSKEDPL